MFVSAPQLVTQYGIDDVIATFFVDREPPANNLYWHEKLLYLRPAVGYLFIPLVVDLLQKAGIAKADLLSDAYVQTMEQIGHISALEEIKRIDAKEAIDQCAAVAKSNCVSDWWYDDVYTYLTGGENYITQKKTAFNALHRGDVFLFSLCAISFPQAIRGTIVEQWFALISTLLLLDDADDTESDMQTGEENAFLEHGFSQANMDRAEELVAANLLTIAQFNRTLANELRRQYSVMVQKPINLLNKQL